MPPRKRKVPASKNGPQCLQTIAEEEGQCVPSAYATVSEARDSRGRTKDEAIDHIAGEVTDHIRALQSKGRDLAGAVRLESQMACSRLPKKVQNMSVADFFSLSPDEAKQTTLTKLISRLMLFPGSKAGQNGSLSAAPPPVQFPIPNTTAPTTRTTRRTATRTGQQQQEQEQQHCTPTPPTATHPRDTHAATQCVATTTASAAAKDQDQPSTSKPVAPPTEPNPNPPTALPPAQQQQQQQQGHVHQETAVCKSGGTAETTHVLQDRTNLDPAEAGRVGQMLPPKRGARPRGKQAVSQEEQEDAEAAQQAPVAATPAQHGHSMVAATPVGNGVNNTMHTLPGTATLATNFTLVKRTAARGRTGRRAGDDNAIMISTSDGRQFMVDAGTGVANLPDKHRNEVLAQLEVLHQLTGEALKV